MALALRVALIGAGFMGRAHSLAYGVVRNTEGLEALLVPVVVVDSDTALATRFADQHAWPETASDWRDVLERDDIDVIDICTPPQFHEEIALAAIAAGKHVFCEKPITNDADQALRMAAAAEAAGVVTQVGFNYRNTPAIRYGHGLVREGRLGVPLQLRAEYLQDTGFTADPNRWRATKRSGGSGAVGDIGSHVIDVAEMLCGDIVRVAARSRSIAPGAGWVDESTRVCDDLVDDGAVWIAEFASGVIGTFAVSFYAPGRKNGLAFGLDGSKGALGFTWNDRESFQVSYVDDPADHSGFRTVRTNSAHPGGAWRIAGLGTGYLDVSALQFVEFARAIATGGDVGVPDFAHAAHIQQVVEAIAEASVSDRWIDVPERRGGRREAGR